MRARTHQPRGTNVWPLAARAQTYPSRPITMVVPFAAGGAFDVIGRILAARMSEILGQQVIIENTTGAAGIIHATTAIYLAFRWGAARRACAANVDASDRVS